MNEPRRREQRRTHLDASVVPVERALLARADAVEAKAIEQYKRAPDGMDVVAVARRNAEAAEVLRSIAGEFRALADELHYW